MYLNNKNFQAVKVLKYYSFNLNCGKITKSCDRACAGDAAGSDLMEAGMCVRSSLTASIK